MLVDTFYLWMAGIYAASVLTSYFIGTIGLKNVITDVENLKNLKIQSPITITAPATVATVPN